MVFHVAPLSSDIDRPSSVARYITESDTNTCPRHLIGGSLGISAKVGLTEVYDTVD